MKFTMSRALALLLLACLNAGTVYGMDCTLGHSKNFIDKIINSCPEPFGSSDKSYCCISLTEDTVRCCTAEEFALEMGLGVMVPIIITVAVVTSLIVCCISCLCCSCCPWYRRRHRGTVYGKVQVPTSIVHVINAPPNVTQPTNLAHTSAYPTNATGVSEPPPQYSAEVYAKQAAYNPNYVQ